MLATAKPLSFDVQRIREDFPILHQQVRGKPLSYLDNAATAQKPKAVIEAMDRYYRETNANIHRGVHRLSELSTRDYENARIKIQRWLNAADPSEIIFVRGATEAINLVASSWGRKNLNAGDEVLITEMEHHSNIVPWQLICQERGAHLKVIPFDDRGELDLAAYQKLLGPKTRLVSVVHVSNTLGTVNPVKQIIELAHAAKVPVLLDGAQAVPHLRPDVRALGADFYVFSGHKLFGPTGIGALYGRKELLEQLPPYQGGGDMIRSVSFEKTVYNSLPHRLEAGTPNIAGTIGLGAAIDYLGSIDFEAAAAWEKELLDYGTEVLSGIGGLKIIGTAREKVSVLSFTLEGIHPHDIGTILDQHGVAIRTGHHCTEPIMAHYGIPATARASLAFYNTKEEIDRLAKAIQSVQEMFG